MNKFLHKFFNQSLLKYIISFVISLILCALWLLLKKNYSLLGWQDAIGFTFFVMFFIGSFSLINYLGMFTTLTYGFYYLFNGKSKQYESLVDYNEKRETKLKNKSYPFATYYIVSLPYLIIYLILFLFR